MLRPRPFDLAKVRVSDADEPSRRLRADIEGVVRGTAPYMSPEQARGQRVDRRTDVGTFGCIL